MYGRQMRFDSITQGLGPTGQARTATERKDVHLETSRLKTENHNSRIKEATLKLWRFSDYEKVY
jgi:hypothetical protein